MSDEPDAPKNLAIRTSLKNPNNRPKKRTAETKMLIENSFFTDVLGIKTGDLYC